MEGLYAYIYIYIYMYCDSIRLYLNGESDGNMGNGSLHRSGFAQMRGSFFRSQ